MVEARVGHLPLSKSIAARAIVLAALAGDDTDPAEWPQCDDITVLCEAIKRREGEIDLNASGTALRFLTAYYASRPGTDVVLTGSARLCERPVAPLVDALRSLGADIEYLNTSGYAPIRIKGRALSGGEVAVDGSQSSQFASALAMIAPGLPGGLRINFSAQMPSLPYLKMTLAMLENRGVETSVEAYTAIVEQGSIKPADPEVEYDWSAAAFWYAICAVSAGWVTLPNMAPNSLQGDAAMIQIGERIGVGTEFTDEATELSASPEVFSRLDLDLSSHPDLVPPLAVTAALIGIPFTFRGIGFLQHKESERLTALAEGLAQLGIAAEVIPDGLAWDGERMPIFKMPEIDPHSDHRIAMAFAVAAFAVPGIVIHNPEVVAKSYPGFFDDLSAAGFTICGPDDPVPAEFLPQESDS